MTNQHPGVPLNPTYDALLAGLRERGYEARDFEAVEPNHRHVILRHDVDISLDRALEMARIEAAHGARAVYFVLVTSPFYNVLSEHPRKALREIAALGHRIGLHLDCTALVGGDDIAAAATWQGRILGDASGATVDSLSFHRPATNLKGVPFHEIPTPGFLNAYAPAYFNDIGYCSDSRGGWHYGHPFDHPAIREGRALQLLTHPVWWTTGSTKTPIEALLSQREHAIADIDAALRAEFNVGWESFDSESPGARR